MKITVSLMIDGIRMFADQGATILEVARQNNIFIPTLCYHPRLKPLGHCRICIVKIDGIERPITSCDNPVADGMTVTTDSPELREMRSQIVELTLATHPYKDCLTCVRTGTCELQERAYQYQVNLPEQLDRDIPTEISSDNLYIERDEEKCILCGRCIQVCRSGPGRFVYSMVGNGVNTRVVPLLSGLEVSLEEAGCIFCGQCVDVCPVAAITERGRKEGGREWELTSVSGICIECSLGCYLKRRASGNNLIKVMVPVEGDKVGWLCQKGRFGFIKGENEAKPFTGVMKKSEYGYTETNYQEAIIKTAENLLAVKNNHGATALGILASGKLSNEEVYLLQKLGRTVLGTPNLDLGAEPGWVKAFMGMQEITGTGVIGPTPATVRNAETLFIIGTGLEESHPVMAMAVDQAGRFGEAVIIRTDPAAEDGPVWKGITLKPGKGGYSALFKGIAMLKQEEEVTAAANASGVSAEILTEVTRQIAAKKSCIIACPSFFESADQNAIEALISMARSCGAIGQGRSRLLLLSKFSNAAGVLAAGGTALLGPDYLELDSDAGLNRNELLAAIETGGIKGLLLFSDNFTEFKPAGLKFVAALCSSTEGAPAGADFLFKTQTIIDKNGLFTNASGQTRLNEAVLKMDSNTPEDWRLICDLAQALGAKWHYNSLDDVREEMKG